ncbi:hypothetical protein [Streptomyces sp. DW26H14]|uniref:hypothetical protein n=1 Tax=Streptomyces sp. DW26H14 TaxID=3435395 RepID=UPI00403DA012
MTRKAARRAAAGVKATAVRGAQADPTARGADWQGATVTAVGTDGTVTVATVSGTVPSVRLVDTAVGVGDDVIISRNGAGNWICLGARMRAADYTAWTAIAIAGSSVLSRQVEARIVTIAGTRYLQMRGSVNKSLTGDTAIATLPANMRPPVTVTFPIAKTNSAGNSTVRAEITTAGVLTVYFPTGGSSITWMSFEGVNVSY